jgi:phosphotransferase system HPr-like phosphotransfer protein
MRRYYMKTIHITLKEAQSVKKFVNAISRYPYDVDLRAGRHVVDAKSILGIFSLDLSKPITMEIYSDHCDDLLAEVTEFME